MSNISTNIGRISPRLGGSRDGCMFRAETRTLIGGGVYSYIHVLPDRFLFKLMDLNLISKETRRAEHEYMNTPPPQLTF